MDIESNQKSNQGVVQYNDADESKIKFEKVTAVFATLAFFPVNLEAGQIKNYKVLIFLYLVWFVGFILLILDDPTDAGFIFAILFWIWRIIQIIVLKKSESQKCKALSFILLTLIDFVCAIIVYAEDSKKKADLQEVFFIPSLISFVPYVLMIVYRCKHIKSD